MGTIIMSLAVVTTVTTNTLAVTMLQHVTHSHYDYTGQTHTSLQSLYYSKHTLREHYSHIAHTRTAIHTLYTLVQITRTHYSTYKHTCMCTRASQWDTGPACTSLLSSSVWNERHVIIATCINWSHMYFSWTHNSIAIRIMHQTDRTGGMLQFCN